VKNKLFIVSIFFLYLVIIVILYLYFNTYFRSLGKDFSKILGYFSIFFCFIGYLIAIYFFKDKQ